MVWVYSYSCVCVGWLCIFFLSFCSIFSLLPFEFIKINLCMACAWYSHCCCCYYYYYYYYYYCCCCCYVSCFFCFPPPFMISYSASPFRLYFAAIIINKTTVFLFCFLSFFVLPVYCVWLNSIEQFEFESWTDHNGAGLSSFIVVVCLCFCFCHEIVTCFSFIVTSGV